MKSGEIAKSVFESFDGMSFEDILFNHADVIMPVASNYTAIEIRDTFRVENYGDGMVFAVGFCFRL